MTLLAYKKIKFIRVLQAEGKTRGHSKLWRSFATNNFCQVHPCVHYIITTHSTNLKNYERSIKFSFQRNLNLYLDYSNFVFLEGLASHLQATRQSKHNQLEKNKSRIINPKISVQKFFVYSYKKNYNCVIFLDC